jgi:hypothetical protein
MKSFPVGPWAEVMDLAAKLLGPTPAGKNQIPRKQIPKYLGVPLLELGSWNLVLRTVWWHEGKEGSQVCLGGLASSSGHGRMIFRHGDGFLQTGVTLLRPAWGRSSIG